jgi:F420H(2)-dependent quinone reductase
MSTSPEDFNARIIDEFHANDGRAGGVFEHMPLLLLHHTGAKTGKSRVNVRDEAQITRWRRAGGLRRSSPAWRLETGDGAISAGVTNHSAFPSHSR